jgi:hypothetical protein
MTREPGEFPVSVALVGVMETLLTGDVDVHLVESDAFRLCLDLGLVIQDRSTPKVANPIYREVLAREMTWGTQSMIPAPEFRD